MRQTYMAITTLAGAAVALLLLAASPAPAFGQLDVPGMFVFGSSSVDTGNNVFLNTSGKPNFLPYGVDYPEGPTGRFCDGRNIADSLADVLGLPPLPPFLDPNTTGDKILHGVNFASGGSGILDSTGTPGEMIPLRQQVQYYTTVTLPALQAECSPGAVNVSNFIFTIGAGANDYLINYYSPQSPLSKLPPAAFADLLLADLTVHMQTLYQSGARKFVVLGIPPLGCTPVVTRRLNVSADGCVDGLNLVLNLYNSRLESFADSPAEALPGATVVYVSLFKIVYGIITNPAQNNITDPANPCCMTDSTGVLCVKGSPACAQPGSHVFFDGLHTTQAVNDKIAAAAYGASPSSGLVSPMNVRDLALL